MIPVVTRFRLGSLAEFPPVTGRTFQLGARRVAVYRGGDGALYARPAAAAEQVYPVTQHPNGDLTLELPSDEVTSAAPG